MSSPDVLAAAALVGSMSVDDAAPDFAALESVEGTSSDHGPQSRIEDARREWRAQCQQQPGDGTQRAGPSDITNSKEQPSITRSSVVSTSSEAVTVDSSEELLQPPTVETFKEWVKAMLTDASGHRVDLSELESTFKSTKGLLVNAKQAIFELFGMKSFKAAICCSPERADLKISQEEALGWLLAYARGRKLLTEEARPIGKLAGTFATEAKKELDAIRDAAKMQRSRARKKGGSAEELAAIDTKVTAQRAEITEAAQEVKHMPAANTVIVERRAPKVDPKAQRRHALEAMFGSKVASEVIDAARACEDSERELFNDFDEFGDPIDHAETRRQIELAFVEYKHALARLKAAFPAELNDCADDGSCDHKRVCPCGRGLRGAWPWVVQTPGRGFCELAKEERGKFYEDGEWSCRELHAESQRCFHAYAWGPDAASAWSNGRAEDAKRERARVAEWRGELY